MYTKDSKRFKSVVLSVGAGSCETEMQADPSVLIVCLDTNKRSLYAGRMNERALKNLKKTNLLMKHFDMAGTGNLIKSIRHHTHLPITVLFQHPSPSTDTKSRNAIRAAGSGCVEALFSKSIQEVAIVFDFKDRANCWSEKEVCSAFGFNMNVVKVSKENVICSEEGTIVCHPVFGNISRVGWAHMKKGVEKAITVTAK